MNIDEPCAPIDKEADMATKKSIALGKVANEINWNLINP
jgi:hypothetical protein